MKAYITPAEASRITGIPAAVIRQNVRRGIWKFGDYIPPKNKGGSATYYIWVSKLENHIGRKINDTVQSDE